jgi:uncharacterized protein (TIGR03000 family)
VAAVEPAYPVIVGQAAPVMSYPVAGHISPVIGTPVVPPAAPTMPMATDTTATVLIKAPVDVKVTVDGQATTRGAAEEVFSTPTLEPGRTYRYVFKAEGLRDGKPVSLTRSVTVQAGKRSEADFSELGAAVAADVAKVTVRLPEDAKLYVDGTPCPLTTAVRTFETPKLEPGRQYYYTVKAEQVRDGQTRSDSRRVVVEAGKESVVEFKDLPVVQAVRR